eukprot:15332316-Ditylum_brightwellii.AAC.1
MENDILPVIEDDINDVIAPVLFSTCGDIRRLQTRKRSEALGLSSLSPDASIEDGLFLDHLYERSLTCFSITSTASTSIDKTHLFAY